MRLGLRFLTPTRQAVEFASQGIQLNGKYVIVANLWLAVFIQVAGISSYSPFVPLIKAELGFSFAQFGLIASIFFLSYTLMQVLSGRASDHGYARAMILIGTPVIVALSMLFGAIQNVYEALAIRILAGIAAALIFVPAIRVLTRIDPESLSDSIALIGTAIGAGGLYVSLAGPRLALMFGWREGIALMMAPGFLIFALNLKYVPSTRVTSVHRRFPRWILRRKETWILGVQQFVRVGAWFTVTIWLPTFFTSALGYNLVLSGIALTVFSVAGIFASMVGGRVAARLSSFSKVMMLSFAILGGTIILIAFAASGMLAWGLVVVFGIFDFLPFGPIFAILPKLYEEGDIGLVTGFENSIANLGAVAVPFFFGWLINPASESFTLSWLQLGILCLAVSLISIPVIRSEKKGLIAH